MLEVWQVQMYIWSKRLGYLRNSSCSVMTTYVWRESRARTCRFAPATGLWVEPQRLRTSGSEPGPRRSEGRDPCLYFPKGQQPVLDREDEDSWRATFVPFVECAPVFGYQYHNRRCGKWRGRVYWGQGAEINVTPGCFRTDHNALDIRGRGDADGNSMGTTGSCRWPTNVTDRCVRWPIRSFRGQNRPFHTHGNAKVRKSSSKGG